MKIIHTADWHLGSLLKRVDRGEDLRRAVDRVFRYCEEHEVDVLLIAGDLFDSVHRPEEICRAVDHLKDTARPFLQAGGTILALTGNHDGEIFCETLGHAQSLADPASICHGDALARGRFYLTTRPTFVRLADRHGQEVQFVLMTYPTASRYLDGVLTPYGPGAESKNRRLLEGFRDLLARMKANPHFDPGLHSVLAAHLYLTGTTLPSGHVIDEEDGIVLPPEDLGAGWAYVALGHVHKPQAIGDVEHVRYSGSIERLKIDEMGDDKGVVLVEIGPEGRRGSPRSLPLEATPFLDLVIHRPSEQMAGLRAAHPDASRTLVKCQVNYTAGVDDCDRIRDELFALFPRCYAPTFVEANVGSPVLPMPDQEPTSNDVRTIVLDYLRSQLGDREDAGAVLAAAETLIEEDRP